MKIGNKLFLILLLSISLIFSSSSIVQARGRGGYGGFKSSYRSSRSYTPRVSRPRSYSPKTAAPRTYKPKVYTPKTYSPKVYTPRTYTPKIYTPKTYTPKSYGSKTSYSKPERSQAKKREFLESRGLTKVPAGCEVDHIVPLSKGGADEPYNMQILSKGVHKQKTKMDLSK